MQRYSTDTSLTCPAFDHEDLSQPSLDSDEIGEQEKELLKSIWEDPHNGTVQKFRRIGVSRRKGQKIRQKLIQTGLVKKAPCVVPEGQVVLMEVTKKGRQVLREIGVETSDYNPNEGGAVHRYWVERMAKQYRDLGYNVEKEVVVGDRVIDVVAKRADGKRIGIEIIRKGDSCDIEEFELEDCLSNVR